LHTESLHFLVDFGIAGAEGGITSTSATRAPEHNIEAADDD